jgi:hypothetical protein
MHFSNEAAEPFALGDGDYDRSSMQGVASGVDAIGEDELDDGDPWGLV